MHFCDIIRDYKCSNIIDCMSHAGLRSVESHYNGMPCVKRNIDSIGCSYYVFFFEGAIRFICQIDDLIADYDFVVNWNNNETISPLIRYEIDFGEKNTFLLKFYIISSMGVSFGLFKNTALGFETAVIKLHECIKAGAYKK